ncbi:MAG: aminodeoxychorismate/anthranilate synthase component II [Deltaproteobacteria bacterium]|jgi:anthranilate synthase component 2|nr:aminodeoxychorismate/anthranilate synthase component II [Deltaproteobacteria bacterium]MBW2385600.1 aminodeoxychorismate/anthranilate synthase component II [Deltaproteobacteria bacterium]MBW2697721.1 aminodeoxychorismate/anthranilate synthase component II [Deltaproteobacteria bacterium]
MIDNYDSFTYNLVQYLGELGVEVGVVRNDSESVDALLARESDGLVISPGPGTPEDAGVSVECVERFATSGVPVLGVCLGHQSIGTAFGGRIVRARSIMHGKTSTMHHDGKGVFEGLPQDFVATRYHSLVIESASCPDVLEVTARTSDGEIMGVRHCELPVEGVQFHPESILTGVGKQLLGNFVARCAEGRAA